MTPTNAAPPTSAPRGLAAFTERVFEFVQEQWRAVLFSAGIALILESRGVLLVLTKFSLLVVSSLAAQAPPAAHALAPGMPTVVLLTSQDFITRYGERSPLDRCTLSADIQRVLDKAPARLAIDFDLSPLIAASTDEQQCQRRLDTLLDQHASTLVLLVPFPAATPALLQLKHDWLLARCQHGLHFADGALQQSMGLVTEQLISDDPAGRARMAEQLQDGGSNPICQVAQAGNAAQNRWVNGLNDPAEGAEAPEGETAPINFRALTQQVAVLELGSPAFANQANLSGHAVLLGGDWGRDDSFLTAIGTLPGVVIHAARLASLNDPVRSLPPWVSLWGDIVVALCFAWVIGKFWHGYVMARRVDLHFAHGGRATALSMLVMGTFVAVYLSLVLFFFLAAEHMFSNWGVVIAPLLIAVSILLDGFVSGPVEQISHLLEAETRAVPVLTGAAGEAALSPQVGAVLRQTGLAWLGVLGFAAASLMLPAVSHGIAAWLFAAAQVALALTLLRAWSGLAWPWQVALGATAAVVKLPALSHLLPAGLLTGAQGALVLLLLAHGGMGVWKLWRAHQAAQQVRQQDAQELDAQTSQAQRHDPSWQRLARGGTALCWLRRFIFWSVLGVAAGLLISHSLHG